MAEHKDQQSGQATKGVGGSDPRQHNETSTGRGESGSARDESRRSVANQSTSDGRSSNESDRGTRSGSGEAGSHKPSHSSQPDEMPLTLGSNGGGRDDEQPANADSGRKPAGTEAQSQKRKAS
jgi:hypothetical protein